MLITLRPTEWSRHLPYLKTSPNRNHETGLNRSCLFSVLQRDQAAEPCGLHQRGASKIGGRPGHGQRISG